ncbi:MAG: LptA/OstA family protein [Alphaproteobacteria bacterium]
MKKLLIAFMFVFPLIANADDLKIKADEKVEWHNKEAKMVAVGNAEASNSSMKVNANKLEAFYSEANGKKEISKVFGFDNVVLTSDSAKGYGDKLEYSMAKEEAILTGKPAKIVTENETLEADDNIFYYPTKKEAIAKGGVKAKTKDGNTIIADELKAYFKETNNSSMELDKVDIFDNIKIITKDATVTANTGTYYPTLGEVHLFDDVTIFQKDNELKGDKAVANLKTGVSKIIAGSKGQVKGTFKAKE